MSYIDGFVIPVRTEDKQKFIDFANRTDRLMLEFGATEIIETWGDDVKAGQVTDFRRAVQATEDESVVFSWIVWPDKATRDAGFAKMMEDERFTSEPMPFDGKRMIFGGFAPVVELRA